MKILVGRIFASLAIGGVLLSALTLNSCRDRVVTVHDTVSPGTGGWVYASSGTTAGLVTSQFLQNGLGFVGGENGALVKTTDGGTTWSPLPTAAPTYGNGGRTIYGLFFTDAAHGTVIGDGIGVFHTSDGGMNWSESPLSSAYWPRSLCFTSAYTGFLGTSDPMQAPLAGQNGEIWRTDDAGQSWAPVLTSYTGGIYEIKFAPNSSSQGVALGKFGTAFWTSDGGASWNPGVSDQPNASFSRVTFTNSTTAFAVASTDQDHGWLLQSVDGGRTWHTIKTLAFMAQGISSNGNGTITAAGYYGEIVESTDGGATWNVSTLGSDRWINVNYATATRAIMIGSAGHIVLRNK